MKRRCCLLLICILTVLLAACVPMQPLSEETTAPPATTEETTIPSETTVPETTEETTVSETEEETTIPGHSALYMEGLDADSVITYFEEVCLAAEYTHSGDPALVQKWTDPIYYTVEGSPTEEDLAVLEGFAAQLNAIEGFPGIYEAGADDRVKLEIFFCDQAQMGREMGDWVVEDNLDGAVTFQYNRWNRITEAVICIRTDLMQTLRSSVILEELYNGLGPIQDTSLREDSIIYQGYSEPQSLTEVDLLILKLLYHPDIQCGMNAEECREVIHTLYY